MAAGGDRAGGWGSARAAGVALVAAALAAAVLYAPYVVAAGPGRVWDALVVQATRDGEWWRLPFPGGFHGSDPLDFARWLLPYAALAAVVAAVVRARSAAPSLAGLLVLALGASAYLLSRADEEHAQTLLVIVAAIAAIAKPRPILVAVLALVLATGAANRASALLRPPALVPLHVDGAGATLVPPPDAAALPRLVRRVQSLVPPGRPIYVAPRRSDLVTFSDPLLHFLTRRPNVLRRDVLLQARPDEQAKIVDALRRAKPRVVIRWTDPASATPEPNRRGRPSGSRALDEYLDRAYTQDSRFGAYAVLVPR